jgi:predicted dehydrogenase
MVSVLVAGCGSAGTRHARILRELGVDDLRACDPSPARRESLRLPGVRLHDSYEAGLAARPDAVFVCTPPGMHVPMALEALRAGAHVFSEKPLSDRVEGIDALEALARERRKKVMVGLCFRYHEGLLRARRLLEEGRIGRLVSIRAMIGEHLPEVRPDYRTLFTSESEGAFDLAHEIDLAAWFAERPVRRVECVAGAFSEIGIRAPDVVEILVEFAGRLVASVHLDFFQKPRRRQTELLGTEGAILVEFARWDRSTVSVFDGAWTLEEIPTDRDDMFRAEDREFLEAVSRDRPIRLTIAEGRKSVEIAAAARSRSAPRVV